MRAKEINNENARKELESISARQYKRKVWKEVKEKKIMRIESKDVSADKNSKNEKEKRVKSESGRLGECIGGFECLSERQYTQRGGGECVNTQEHCIKPMHCSERDASAVHSRFY